MIDPHGFGRVPVEFGLLPGLSPGGRFKQMEFHALVKGGTVFLKPIQDVARQLAIMRPGFSQDDPRGTRQGGLECLGQTEGQQLAEQRTDGDTGEKVARTTNLAVMALIVTKLRVVQGQLHETGKWQHPPGLAGGPPNDL